MIPPVRNALAWLWWRRTSAVVIGFPILVLVLASWLKPGLNLVVLLGIYGTALGASGLADDRAGSSWGFRRSLPIHGWQGLTVETTLGLTACALTGLWASVLLLLSFGPPTDVMSLSPGRTTLFLIATPMVFHLTAQVAAQLLPRESILTAGGFALGVVWSGIVLGPGWVATDAALPVLECSPWALGVWVLVPAVLVFVLPAWTGWSPAPALERRRKVQVIAALALGAVGWLVGLDAILVGQSVESGKGWVVKNTVRVAPRGDAVLYTVLDRWGRRHRVIAHLDGPAEPERHRLRAGFSDREWLANGGLVVSTPVGEQLVRAPSGRLSELGDDERVSDGDASWFRVSQGRLLRSAHVLHGGEER
ncbi:MAG: hypothetical protein AAF533_23680 [Acidobacteriota bacterium]